MTNVNTFRLYCNFLANKSLAGFTQTKAEFETTAMAAQLVPFSRDLQTFITTKVVSNYLQSFLTVDAVYSLDPINNIIIYPSDFEALSSAGTYYNKTQNDADQVDNADWYEMQRPNSLNYPTLRYPKYQQTTTGIQFLPKDAGTVYLNYFHTPVQPIWNYSTINNEQVFNPTGSVDFEWGLFALNEVSSIFLQMVGINLREDELAGFAKQFTAETQIAL